MRVNMRRLRSGEERWLACVCAREFITWIERSVARARVRTQGMPGIARPRAFGRADPHGCGVDVRDPLAHMRNISRGQCMCLPTLCV